MFDLSQPLQLTAALVPDLVLMVGAMILLLWAAWRPDSDAHQRRVGIASVVVAFITLLAVVYYLAARFTAGPGVIAVDSFRWMVDLVILIGAIGSILLQIEDQSRLGNGTAESHVLILLSAAGMMLLVAARDLMIVFLGIEMMSIAVYALAGLNRRSPRSAEAALKYFLLGAFSTGFLLYGIALVYGATGSTNLHVIGQRIVDPALGIGSSPLLTIGIALLLVGFGFKVATVPFHMWAPDVYEGSPTAVTAFMVATVKTAAFAAFLRVWLEAFPTAYHHWHGAVVLLAVLTMIFGNVIALAQKNLKRLLAYSSIAHAGYLMVALATATSEGATALVFYVLAYTLTNFGAFGVILALTRDRDGNVTLDEIAGLWTERPALAVAMSVFMLSLMGFPIFGGAGFLAKWYVLKAALQAPVPQTTLAVILVLTSVVAAGYYLYVVMLMFMRPRPEGVTAPARRGGLTASVIVVAAVAILVLGVVPDYVVRLVNRGRPAAGIPPTAQTTIPPAAPPLSFR